MPRLANPDYLFIHHYLHNVWIEQRRGFSLISTRDQRYLHDYFRPSDQLTDAQLLSHRKTISFKQPQLPQCAGRALRHLARPGRDAKYARAHGSKYDVVVYPLLRPQPHVRLLLGAMQALAQRMAEEQS